MVFSKYIYFAWHQHRFYSAKYFQAKETKSNSFINSFKTDLKSAHSWLNPYWADPPWDLWIVWCYFQSSRAIYDIIHFWKSLVMPFRIWKNYLHFSNKIAIFFSKHENILGFRFNFISLRLQTRLVFFANGNYQVCRVLVFSALCYVMLEKQ